MSCDNYIKTTYYSIYCNEYESGRFTGSDILGEVRKSFFEGKKGQKNKIAKKMYGKMYHYMYLIENGIPMQWKKVVDGMVLEICKVGNGFYEIICRDKNKNIFKIDAFDFTHNWKNTKYFSKSCKTGPTMIVSPCNESEELMVKEFDQRNNKFNEYPLHSRKINHDEFITKIPKVICSTNNGDVLFYKNKEDDVKGEKIIPMNQKDLTVNSNNEDRIYLGDLKNKLKSGHGRIVYIDGRTIFEGDFLNGKKEGMGVQFYNDSKLCYVGNFKNGEKNGIGVSFKSGNERIHVGRWQKNRPQKMCTTFNQKGEMIFTGNIVEGERNGLGIVYDHKNKRALVGKWHSGKLSGPGTIFNYLGEIEFSGELDEETLKEFVL